MSQWSVSLNMNFDFFLRNRGSNLCMHMNSGHTKLFLIQNIAVKNIRKQWINVTKTITKVIQMNSKQPKEYWDILNNPGKKNKLALILLPCMTF